MDNQIFVSFYEQYISLYVKIEDVRGQNKFQNTWVDRKQGEMKGTLVQNRTG